MMFFKKKISDSEVNIRVINKSWRDFESAGYEHALF